MTAPDKKSPDALDRAIAEVIRVTRISGGTGEGDRWQGTDFTGRQEAHDPFPIDDAIAEILNAVVAGRLTRSDLCASGQQVRALVWDEYAPGCFFGKSECGDYSIAPSASAFHEGEIRLSDVEGNFSYFAWPEAAKAAAQADYERRILAALTPAPQAEGQCLLTNDAIRAYAKEHRIYIREHGSCPDIQHGGWIHPFTLTISSDELRAMFSALSSQASCVPHTADSEAQGDLSPTDAIQAPQPEGQVRAAAQRILELYDAEPGVICNGCGWEGDEDGLIATVDAEDGEPCRACPDCGTDGYLMDRPAQPSAATPTAQTKRLEDRTVRSIAEGSTTLLDTEIMQMMAQEIEDHRRTAQEAVPDRLLKEALFASIEPYLSSPLYCGVAVTAMTQACAGVFYVPRDWTREQIKDWLGNPQGFAHPPQPSETLAEAAYLAGFMASSEGYHGEYPGIEYEHDARWCFERDAALRALKGEDE